MRTSGYWAAAAVVVVVGSAQAAMITFRHAGFGSGTIDGMSFDETSFFITAEGDTVDRVSLGFGWYIDHMTADISITGVGEFEFLTATRTFVNNDASLVGFSRAGGGGLDLFNGPTHADLATWTMLSSIGPLFGDGSLLQWEAGDIDTSGGILIFDGSTNPAKFKAEVIPAPAGFALLGAGAVGALIRRRR